MFVGFYNAHQFNLRVLFCSQALWVVGSVSTNQCPTASLASPHISDCENAATRLGLTYIGYVTMQSSPKGCYQGLSRNAYFNKDSTGASSPSFRPICKQAGVIYIYIYI